MYSVLDTISESTYFYISKNITSYTFLFVFEIVESLQCVLNSLWFPTATELRCRLKQFPYC